jgi:hypothetical protein
MINCTILNDPIGDLDDLAFSPESKEPPEDESLTSTNWQSISVWDD